jgi:hypothetical protein
MMVAPPTAFPLKEQRVHIAEEILVPSGTPNDGGASNRLSSERTASAYRGGNFLPIKKGKSAVYYP